MSEGAKRALILAEVFGFCGLVSWFIWRLQEAYPRSGLVFGVWLMVSFLLHRDTPKTMGWRGDNLWESLKEGAHFFGGAIGALVLVGIALGGLQRYSAHLIMPDHFLKYAAFCFLQQTGLSSYVMNRLLLVEKPIAAAALSGGLFAALHWPNPVLVPLTFIGGLAMTWIFYKQRNIVTLAVGQAILGALVWWAFPQAWHHAMRVGPGYYSYAWQVRL